jgi:multiple sugar transport system permease protein
MNQELLAGGTNIFPTKWIVSNFVEAWNSANFAVYTLNSIYLSSGVMILTIIMTSMAGYVFSRKNFRGKELLYGLFVAFMFVNVGSVTLRPLFELAIKLKMNTSLASVIFISAGTGQATYIFLIRGYMNSIPKELDEAAKIDGCTFFQTFYKIMIPVLKPILATVALLSFRGGWNEYILPLVFTMTDEAKRPLTVGVTMLKNAGDGAAAWNIMFAGASIAIIPILFIYIIASKYFINGMTAGAVKG